jgi:type IX secretion system PorP/SprF family membrane protein
MKYLLILSLFISFNGISQQDPLTSFFWNNYSFFNPAMSGVKHKHEANVTWRNQWDFVNGAPNTLFVNYGINLAEKHGIGVNYLFDAIGFSRANQVKVNYNYQLKLDESRKLVFGTAACLNTISMSPSWVPPTTSNDPSLPASYSDIVVNLDLGIAYYGERLIAGISSTQIPLTTDSGPYNRAPHMFGTVRYEIPVAGSSGILLRTQMRTDFVKYSQDFNIGYNWKNLLEGGIGYRTSDAIIFNLTGIITKNYRVGYSYDFTINALSNISQGSHEITLGMRLPTN